MNASAGLAVAAAVLYLYIGVRPHEPPERFGLVPDIPLDDRGSIFSTANVGTGQAAHDRIRAAIRQRLFAAYRTLAYAESGNWSLATWAQLQWVRDTLDGEGLQDVQARIEVDQRLGDLSFVRLLYELVETASPDEKQAAADAKRDGTTLVGELATVTPNTEEPVATLKHVVSMIASSPGLQPFVSEFPPFNDISLPTDDD